MSLGNNASSVGRKRIRLIPVKNHANFECSACGEKFVPSPFRPDELLQKAFQNHVEKNHSKG